MTEEESFKNIDFFKNFISPCSTFCIWIDITTLKVEFLDTILDDELMRSKIIKQRGLEQPLVYVDCAKNEPSFLVYEDKNISCTICLKTNLFEDYVDKSYTEAVDLKKVREEFAELLKLLKNK